MDLNDNRLAQLARGDEAASAQDVSDIAAELLRLRRFHRGDSRRALQVRRMRWAVENMIIKVEHWFDAVGAVKPPTDSLLAALARVGDNLLELQKLVQSLPLELEDISVASVISKWLRSQMHEALPKLSDQDMAYVADAIERGDWREVLRG